MRGLVDTARVSGVRTIRDIAPLLLALCALGCAPGGDDLRNRWEAYMPESGAYRVHFAQPPWELVESSGDSVFLRVKSNAMQVTGLEGPGKYELRVALVAGDATMSADAARRDFAARGYVIDEPGRVVISDTGEQGVEVLATAESPVLRRYRSVRFAHSAGRVLQLDFEATPRLDTAEVDAMVDLVEIEPAP